MNKTTVKVFKIIFLLIIVISYITIIILSGGLDKGGGNGCVMRYPTDNDGKITAESADVTLNDFEKIIRIKANDPSKENPKKNRWINSEIDPSAGSLQKIDVSGSLSTCKARYVDQAGKSIIVPRVGPGNSKRPSIDEQYGISVELKAPGLSGQGGDEWFDIAELKPKDAIEITLKPVLGASKKVCAKNTQGNNLICNRFTVYSPQTKIPISCDEPYIRKLEKAYPACPPGAGEDDECYKRVVGRIVSDYGTIPEDIIDACKNWRGYYTAKCQLDKAVKRYKLDQPSVKNNILLPKPYSLDRDNIFSTYKLSPDDISNAEKYKDDKDGWDNYIKSKSEILYELTTVEGLNKAIWVDEGKSCRGIDDHYPDVNYPSWFTNGAGLIFRLADSGAPEFVVNTLSGDNNIIYSYLDEKMNVNDTKKLQVKFFHKNSNAGGYLLGMKHTTCLVGDARNLYYTISESYPSEDEMGNKFDGSINSKAKGNIYFRVDGPDYNLEEAEGGYNIAIKHRFQSGSFIKYLNGVILDLKHMVQDASKKTYENMTCYGGGDDGRCSDFFGYIRAVLIIYVMILGSDFIFRGGIEPKDLLDRVIKIVVISGLMTGASLDFFSTYIRDIIWNYSDIIIANLGGYSYDPDHSPLEFINEVMTRILFSKVFLFQVLAVMSGSMLGLIYLLVTLISIFLFVNAAVRAIMSYVLAFMAIGLLLILGPIFCTFILFSQTRHLFDGWVKEIIYYMFEPIIIIGGFLIFLEIFQVYLDLVLNFSICWRCAIPLHLPFDGLDEKYRNLFCLNWYVPWGVDVLSGESAYRFDQFVVLLAISYIAYRYIDIGRGLTKEIFGGGSSISTAASFSPMKLAKSAFSSTAKHLNRATTGVRVGFSATKFGARGAVGIAKSIGRKKNQGGQANVGDEDKSESSSNVGGSSNGDKPGGSSSSNE